MKIPGMSCDDHVLSSEGIMSDATINNTPRLISVNGKRALKKARVKEGDKITLVLPKRRR